MELGEPRIGDRNSMELFSKHTLVLSREGASPPFLVTINDDYQTLTILDREGNHSLELAWHELKCPMKDFRNVILDVLVTENHLLVYFMDQTWTTQLNLSGPRNTYFIVFQLPLGNFRFGWY